MKHINFTDLRVFLAIADTGNLTRAAAQCCITPSAASVRLKHLEEEAGCSLVTRLPRGLALTSAGERLAAEARKVFQQITRMTDAMTAFCGDERLVVRLAANYNAAVAFLPDDLSGFLLKNPEIRIDQRLLTSRGVAEVIALGEADIGITASSDFHGGLCFYPYREDSLVLFAAHDHPLVKRGGCRFEEALEEDFVALSNEASMQTFMLAKAVELGRPIVPRIRVPSIGTPNPPTKPFSAATPRSAAFDSKTTGRSGRFASWCPPTKAVSRARRKNFLRIFASRRRLPSKEAFPEPFRPARSDRRRRGRGVFIKRERSVQIFPSFVPYVGKEAPLEFFARERRCARACRRLSTTFAKRKSK